MPPSALMAAVGRDGHAHAQARGARRLPSPPLVHEARNEPKSAALVLHEAPRPLPLSSRLSVRSPRRVPRVGLSSKRRRRAQSCPSGCAGGSRCHLGAQRGHHRRAVFRLATVGTGIAEAHSQSQLGAQYKALVQNATPYAGVSTTLPAAPALPAGAGRQAGTVGASLQAKAFQANASLEAEAKLSVRRRFPAVCSVVYASRRSEFPTISLPGSGGPAPGRAGALPWLGAARPER